LLGRHFTLLTDCAPLQWLAGQKIEGLLARWAPATQECNFTISYWKGTENSNADALSHKQIYGNESVQQLCAHPSYFLTSSNIKLTTLLFANFMMNCNLEYSQRDASGTNNHWDDTNKFGHSCS